MTGLKFFAGKLDYLLLGIYVWVTAALFGLVVLDVFYADRLREILDSGDSLVVFAAVSDFLLLVVTASILAAIGAVSVAWNASLARYLLIASILVVLAEALAPVLFHPLLEDSGLGPWVRLAGSGTASALALAAFSTYCVRN